MSNDKCPECNEVTPYSHVIKLANRDPYTWICDTCFYGKENVESERLKEKLLREKYRKQIS